MTVKKDYEKINDKFDGRLAYMIGKHSRTLFFRFDVHFPEYYPFDGSNNDFSRLLKLAKEQLTRHDIEMQYVWCREQKTSEYPHYHVAALVNGNLKRNVYDILQSLTHIWMHIMQSPKVGLINHCDYFNGQRVEKQIQIERPSPNRADLALTQQHWEFDTKIEEVRKRAHYLGKDEQKGDVPKGVREYGSSELPQCR